MALNGVLNGFINIVNRGGLAADGSLTDVAKEYYERWRGDPTVRNRLDAILRGMGAHSLE
jgi:hypothetical protein